MKKKALIICMRPLTVNTPGMEVRCEKCKEILWLSFDSIVRAKKALPDITADDIKCRCLKCSDAGSEEILSMLKSYEKGR